MERRHKPDEWLKLAPEWGFRNEPFRESDFETIREPTAEERTLSMKITKG